ncbi:DUF2339 domain-containing protein [soil metagenome]
MEALIFIAFVIIIILLVNIKSLQRSSAEKNYQYFQSLKKELESLKENNISPVSSAPITNVPVKPTDETVVQWRPVVPIEPVIKQGEILPEVAVKEELKDKVEEIPADTFKVEEKTAQVPPTTTYTRAPVQESWKQQWMKNNPDLEKFIGENLINKIGITVLVLGIAFFVKYAIDQDWINETGRVCIGLGCGVILVGLAHYLRNSYRSFSSVLAGGGIAVFYFTIAFAFHQYHLFSQTAAFVIMVMITIFAVLLALLYDKLELAVIAAIGGFITPFLVSTGSGNYVILFSYLIILNIGMLALSYFKKWPAINVIALFFTVIIYGGWLGNELITNDPFLKYKNALLFATVFYLLFLAMNLVYNIRTSKPFKGFDFSILLVITFGYYAAGMLNLNCWNDGAYQGLFTIILGVVNLGLAWFFYKSQKGDRNLLYLLIGLTLTFISLTAPVQLHGHSITLFWSSEFVLLYWLHQRSNIAVFKYSSFIVMALTISSLLMDWEYANEDAIVHHLPVLYRTIQGFITNLFAIIAFAVFAVLLQKHNTKEKWLLGLTNRQASTIMVLISMTIFYLTCVFGVNLYFYTNTSLVVPNTWHQLITYVFVAAILLLIKKYQLSISAIVQMLMITACVCFYLLGIQSSIQLRTSIISGSVSVLFLWIHWLAAGVLLYLMFVAIQIYIKNILQFSHIGNAIVWLINFVLITIFSVECMHAYIYATKGVQTPGAALQQYIKAGVTIVWALCSFAIMWLGMKYKYKTLRIISLVVFSVALLKLFFYDIRNISEGGKIAAFIMLGVLLLIISFMYQKLKKIIIDDPAA